MPTIQEVAIVLAKPKRLVREMRWSAKPGRNDTGWYLYESALEEVQVGTTVNAFVRCQWRLGSAPFPDKYNLAIIMGEDRVYAWDIDRTEMHRNPSGSRPYSGRTIEGSQEHTWTEVGYGYTEPLKLEKEDIGDAWPLFCKKVNIVQNNGYTDPDSSRWQPELDLR